MTGSGRCSSTRAGRARRGSRSCRMRSRTSPNVLLDRFDIVAWDPRGSGDSTAIDCGNKLDYFFDTDKSPDDAAEIAANVAAARKLANACEERSAALLPHLSSSATVDDMDAIRAALGEEKLTYLGFSYGTYLGALYADRYPTHVRALVLDGALDPSLGFEDVTREQAVGFDSALNAFLDNCARTQLRIRWQRSAPRLRPPDGTDRRGAAARRGRWRAPHARAGEAELGVASALYAGTQGWEHPRRCARDARRAATARRCSSSPTLTPDASPAAPTTTRRPRSSASAASTHPRPRSSSCRRSRSGSSRPRRSSASRPRGCRRRVRCGPYPPEGNRRRCTAPGAPPIVVLGTSNDPATPLKWAQALATQLESGHLVVYEGEGHTAYARGNDCVDDAVDDYLITLKVPAGRARAASSRGRG